jgi:hypothetical protein
MRLLSGNNIHAMKRILLAVFALLMMEAKAQYCGNSGYAQCTIDTNHSGSFYPLSDSLSPFVNGSVSNSFIQYISSGTIMFAGSLVSIQSIRIDSIENLPDGLCWATSDSTNTFRDTGCIKFNGTTCSLPGQYKLRVYVTADVGTPISVNADAAGVDFFIRVKNMGDADTPVDTSQTSANPFIPYSSGILSCTPDTACQAAFTLSPDPIVSHNWFALNQATSLMPLNYSWTWGDGSGSTGATPSHIYATPGNYNICLTISNNYGCNHTYCDSSTYIYKTEDMISVQVVDQLPTGIQTFSNQQYTFSIYPNPASNSVNIAVTEDLLNSTLTLTDITGRQLANVLLTTANRELSTDGYANGVYFATIRKDGGVYSKKLMIQH